MEPRVLAEAVRSSVDATAHHVAHRDDDTATVTAAVVRLLLGHPSARELRHDIGWRRTLRRFEELAAEVGPPPLDGGDCVQHFAAVALASARRRVEDQGTFMTDEETMR